MSKKLLLIDGDQFLFTACVAVEQEIKWDDQNHVLWSNALLARQNFDGMIQRIFDRFKTDKHVLTFSEGVNFRLGVDPSYKNHRVGDRKPLCYAQLRRDIEADYKFHAVDGLEADDVMGILATKPGANAIIVSQDKDMKTIPTTIWNGKDLLHQCPFEADRFHMYQTLVGDTSDGYPGCPGVGPVKAEKLLTFSTDEASPDTSRTWWWARVKEAYEKAGLTEADALVQARLARILRHSDWDGVNKKPILWTP